VIFVISYCVKFHMWSGLWARKCVKFHMWSGLWARKIRTDFWWGNLKERDHSNYRGVDGRMILKWILNEIEWESMDSINLTEDMYNLTDFMSMAVNVQVPQKYEEFFLAGWGTSSFSRGTLLRVVGVQLGCNLCAASVQLVCSWCVIGVQFQSDLMGSPFQIINFK